MTYITEQNLTDVVLKRWQDIPDPRLKEIMQSFIKHLHTFIRDVEPTNAEWFKAIDWLKRASTAQSHNSISLCCRVHPPRVSRHAACSPLKRPAPRRRHF